MKIDKRIVVGIPMLIIHFPFVVLGLLAYFPIRYAYAGYEIMDEVNDVINKKLGKLK
jgi:hypothetical protein